MNHRLQFLCRLSCALVMILTATSAHAVQLLPHRIVYDLSLQDSTARSGISQLTGRIVYEFRGSECDGYTVNYRSVNEIFNGETIRISDQQSSFYENIDDGTFSFINRSFIDLKLDREINGHAEILDDSLVVRFKSDDKNDVLLPQSQFPTQNLIELIERAKKGDTIFESRVFDGSDGGEKSMMTTSIIGPFQEPLPNASKNAQEDQETKILGPSADDGYWPVSVSYFEEGEDGDNFPVYRVAFKLYENGISRDLTIDHGYVVINGKVVRFELLPEDDCT